MVRVYFSWGGTSDEWNEWQTTAGGGLAWHLPRMMQSFYRGTKIVDYDSHYKLHRNWAV